MDDDAGRAFDSPPTMQDILRWRALILDGTLPTKPAVRAGILAWLDSEEAALKEQADCAPRHAVLP